MKTRLAVAPQIADRGHDERKQWGKQFLQIISDEEIFLPRFTDDRRRIDGVTPMKNGISVEDGIIVLERVITVMIAERPLGLPLVGRNVSANGKLGLGDQTVHSRPERVGGGVEFSS